MIAKAKTDQPLPSEITTDRRKHSRHQTSLLIRAEGEPSMAQGRGNVSVEGFCFVGAHELPRETGVEVLFRLPGAGVWIRGWGRILGSEPTPGGVGIRGRFTEIELGDASILHRWLQSITSARSPERAGPQRQDEPEPDEGSS